MSKLDDAFDALFAAIGEQANVLQFEVKTKLDIEIQARVDDQGKMMRLHTLIQDSMARAAAKNQSAIKVTAH